MATDTFSRLNTWYKDQSPTPEKTTLKRAVETAADKAGHTQGDRVRIAITEVAHRIGQDGLTYNEKLGQALVEVADALEESLGTQHNTIQLAQTAHDFILTGDRGRLRGGTTRTNIDPNRSSTAPSPANSLFDDETDSPFHASGRPSGSQTPSLHNGGNPGPGAVPDQALAESEHNQRNILHHVPDAPTSLSSQHIALPPQSGRAGPPTGDSQAPPPDAAANTPHPAQTVPAPIDADEFLAPAPSPMAIAALTPQVASRLWNSPINAGFLPRKLNLPALTRQQESQLHRFIALHPEITFGGVFDHVNQTMRHEDRFDGVTNQPRVNNGQPITLDAHQIEILHQQHMLRRFPEFLNTIQVESPQPVQPTPQPDRESIAKLIKAATLPAIERPALYQRAFEEWHTANPGKTLYANVRWFLPGESGSYIVLGIGGRYVRALKGEVPLSPGEVEVLRRFGYKDLRRIRIEDVRSVVSTGDHIPPARRDAYDALKAFIAAGGKKLVQTTVQEIPGPNGTVRPVNVGQFFLNYARTRAQLPDDIWEALNTIDFSRRHWFANHTGPTNPTQSKVQKFNPQEDIYATALEILLQNPETKITGSTVVHNVPRGDGTSVTVDLGNRYRDENIAELPPREHDILQKHDKALVARFRRGKELDAIYNADGSRIVNLPDNSPSPDASGPDRGGASSREEGSTAAPNSSSDRAGDRRQMEGDGVAEPEEQVVFLQHVLLQLAGDPEPSLWQVSYCPDGDIRLRNPLTGQTLDAAPQDALLHDTLDNDPPGTRSEELLDPPPARPFPPVQLDGNCFYATADILDGGTGDPAGASRMRALAASSLLDNEQAWRQWLAGWQTPTFRPSYVAVLDTVLNDGSWAASAGDFVPNVLATALNVLIDIRIIGHHQGRIRAYNVTAHPLALTPTQAPPTHTYFVRLQHNHYTPLDSRQHHAPAHPDMDIDVSNFTDDPEIVLESNPQGLQVSNELGHAYDPPDSTELRPGLEPQISVYGSDVGPSHGPQPPDPGKIGESFHTSAEEAISRQAVSLLTRIWEIAIFRDGIDGIFFLPESQGVLDAFIDDHQSYPDVDTAARTYLDNWNGQWRLTTQPIGNPGRQAETIIAVRSIMPPAVRHATADQNILTASEDLAAAGAPTSPANVAQVLAARAETIWTVRSLLHDPVNQTTSDHTILETVRQLTPVGQPLNAASVALHLTIRAAQSIAPNSSNDHLSYQVHTPRLDRQLDQIISKTLRQDPTIEEIGTLAKARSIARNANLLHEVNLKLRRTGHKTVSTTEIAIARAALEIVHGAAFTSADLTAEADQIAAHLAISERTGLLVSVRDAGRNLAAEGNERPAPTMDKGKGRAPAHSAMPWSRHGSSRDDSSSRQEPDADSAAAIVDTRRKLMNARMIQDELRARYVKGVGTSTEADGARYREAQEQVHRAEASAEQAEAHWAQVTDGAPLPEVRSYDGYGIGGGAPDLSVRADSLKLDATYVVQGNSKGAVTGGFGTVLYTFDLAPCVAVCGHDGSQSFLIHSDSTTNRGKGGRDLISSIRELVPTHSGAGWTISLIGGPTAGTATYLKDSAHLPDATIYDLGEADGAYITNTGAVATTKSRLAKILGFSSINLATQSRSSNTGHRTSGSRQTDATGQAPIATHGNVIGPLHPEAAVPARSHEPTGPDEVDLVLAVNVYSQLIALQEGSPPPERTALADTMLRAADTAEPGYGEAVSRAIKSVAKHVREHGLTNSRNLNEAFTRLARLAEQTLDDQRNTVTITRRTAELLLAGHPIGMHGGTRTLRTPADIPTSVGTTTRPRSVGWEHQKGTSTSTARTVRPTEPPSVHEHHLPGTLSYIQRQGIRLPVHIGDSRGTDHKRHLREHFEQLVTDVDRALHLHNAPDRTTADAAIRRFSQAFSEASDLRGGLGGGGPFTTSDGTDLAAGQVGAGRSTADGREASTSSSSDDGGLSDFDTVLLAPRTKPLPGQDGPGNNRAAATGTAVHEHREPLPHSIESALQIDQPHQAATPFSPSLTALIGFEMEIPGATVPEYSRGEILLEGKKWTLETDRILTKSDLEFVTTPLSSPKEVHQVAREITDVVATMRRLALASESRTFDLSSVANLHRERVSLRRSLPVTVSDERFSTRLQVTYGIPLHGISTSTGELMPDTAGSIAEKSTRVAEYFASRHGTRLADDARGFIDLLVLYLESAKAKTLSRGATVHARFRMMARSDFTSIFVKLLSEEGRNQVRDLLLPATAEDVPDLMTALNIKPSDFVFRHPYEAKESSSPVQGPLGLDWLRSIVQGRNEGVFSKDLLSPPPGYRLHSGDLGIDYGMGAMGVDEVNKLVLFEIRGAPYRPWHIPLNGRMHYALLKEYGMASRFNRSLPLAELEPPSARISDMEKLSDLYTESRSQYGALERAKSQMTEPKWRVLVKFAKNLKEKLHDAHVDLTSESLQQMRPRLEAAAQSFSAVTGLKFTDFDEFAIEVERLRTILEGFERDLWEAETSLVDNLTGGGL
ncbi:hypothetical protein ABT215_39020 [Streptomyces sp900105755]|uniref:OTU domain-containing protein n=1 Tax=Streptomyces sp. 900105755 TaxID=3154389 RepID=UPI003326A20A